MATAIYMKQEKEGCECMLKIKDGETCTLSEPKLSKAQQDFVNQIEVPIDELVCVQGKEKGCIGCIVFYKKVNFLLTSNIDEKLTEYEPSSASQVH